MEGLRHTEGPWTIGRNGIYGDDDKCICVPFSLNWSNNSRLVAAAPEMLDALISCAKRDLIRIGGINPFTVEAIEAATGMSIKDVLEATARHDAERRPEWHLTGVYQPVT